jgi:hypothetical protein
MVAYKTLPQPVTRQTTRLINRDDAGITQGQAFFRKTIQKSQTKRHAPTGQNIYIQAFNQGVKHLPMLTLRRTHQQFDNLIGQTNDSHKAAPSQKKKSLHFDRTKSPMSYQPMKH